MQKYVADALALTMRKGGRIHNQELKAFIEGALDLPVDHFYNNGGWALYNAALKDEAMEQGMLFVPDREYWYLNPDEKHYRGWLQSTLRRHEPEQKRIIKSWSIRDYVRYVPDDQRRRIREANELYREIIAIWDEEEAAELERDLATV